MMKWGTFSARGDRDMAAKNLNAEAFPVLDEGQMAGLAKVMWSTT